MTAEIITKLFKDAGIEPGVTAEASPPLSPNEYYSRRFPAVGEKYASGEVEMDQNHRSGIGSYSLAFSSKDSLKSFLPSSPN